MIADLTAAVVIAALSHAIIVSIWLGGIHGQLQRIAHSLEKGQ